MSSQPRAVTLLAALVISAALSAPGLAQADDAIGTLSFADAAGRAIVLDEPGVLYLVDFWALGCKPCMQEMPELERLAKEHEPGGRFKFVSVIYGGWKGEKLESIASDYGIGHPVLADPDNWFERLDVNAYPTKMLIRNGKLLQRSRGGGAGAYTIWNPTIRGLLNGGPAEK